MIKIIFDLLELLHEQQVQFQSSLLSKRNEKLNDL